MRKELEAPEPGQVMVWYADQEGEDRYIVLEVLTPSEPGRLRVKLLNQKRMYVYNDHEMHELVGDVRLVEPTEAESTLFAQYTMAPDTVPIREYH